jgi:hypothetical protein
MALDTAGAISHGEFERRLYRPLKGAVATTGRCTDDPNRYLAFFTRARLSGTRLK